MQRLPPAREAFIAAWNAHAATERRRQLGQTFDAQGQTKRLSAAKKESKRKMEKTSRKKNRKK